MARAIPDYQELTTNHQPLTRRARLAFIPAKGTTMIRLLVDCVAVLTVVAMLMPRRLPLSAPIRGACACAATAFKPLSYDEMTTAQKTMLDHLLAGRAVAPMVLSTCCSAAPRSAISARNSARRRASGSSLPQRLYELAILVTAVTGPSQYEWQAHHRRRSRLVSAGDCGRDAEGRRPPSMQKDEEAVYNSARSC